MHTSNAFLPEISIRTLNPGYKSASSLVFYTEQKLSCLIAVGRSDFQLGCPRLPLPCNAQISDVSSRLFVPLHRAPNGLCPLTLWCLRLQTISTGCSTGKDASDARRCSGKRRMQTTLAPTTPAPRRRLCGIRITSTESPSCVAVAHRLASHQCCTTCRHARSEDTSVQTTNRKCLRRGELNVRPRRRRRQRRRQQQQPKPLPPR